MPTAFLSDDEGDLIQAERDIRAAVGELDLDFDAMAVVSNVNRVAQAIRNQVTQTVLAEHNLSWTAFATLFELSIWGDMESNRLADGIGVTKGTLTGVVKTLEARRLLHRARDAGDKRLVIVCLEPEGTDLVRRLFPRFNAQETLATSGLSSEEQKALAHSLRTILRTLERCHSQEVGA